MINKLFDLIIVGAGPIGLKAAQFATQNQYDFLLIESLDYVGGQLMSLYPNKEIFDLSNHKAIKAKDFIKLLYESLPRQVIENSIATNEEVLDIDNKQRYFLITTSKRKLMTKTIIIATGLGVYMPRLLKCDGSNSCHSIIYSIEEPSFLSGKKVIILGGGDAALDWARQISAHAKQVIIVHRRDTFRGNRSFIDNIENIIIKKPYLPHKVYENEGAATILDIIHTETGEQETISGDCIFVNYGHHPVNNLFKLKQHKLGIEVDEKMKTSINNIFAVGDVASYEGKKRRIEVGFSELNTVFLELEKRFNK